MTNLLERNILSLYGLKFSRWFLLPMPIIVPFFQDLGLSIQEIMWLQSIYSITVVAVEIPSGYASDAIGRKQTLLIGSILTTLGFILYAIAGNFFSLLAAAMTIAIGSSFVSGADSALLYDSLLYGKKELRYTHYEGRMYAICNFSEASAAIFGSILAANYGLRSPYFVQILVASLGIIAVLRLIEPPSKEQFSRSENIKNMVHALRYISIESPILRSYILLSSVLGAATLLMAWFAQPYFQHAKIPLVYFGTLWASLNIAVGIASWFAYRLSTKLSHYILILLIIGSIVSGYWGTAFLPSYLGIASIFILYIGRGLATPILKNAINAHTPSIMRATVLSLRSFVIRFMFAVIAPFLGYITDTYTLNQAMLVSAILFSSISLLLFIVLQRLQAFEPN